MRHAVSRNIRTSGDIKYLTDDSIYFKHLETAKSLEITKMKVDKLECISVNYSHNNENMSSNFTQPSKETSSSMHQVTKPKNPTPNQQTTYESDTDDDSNNSCTVTLHPTY